MRLPACEKRKILGVQQAYIRLSVERYFNDIGCREL